MSKPLYCEECGEDIGEDGDGWCSCCEEYDEDEEENEENEE